MNSKQLDDRFSLALPIVSEASTLALQMFKARDSLAVEVKGTQDWVSNADKGVEDHIRSALLKAFPDDGILGEEHGTVDAKSGYTWVIDPIDGTTNFVNGLPGWCVVLACVHESRTVIGVIQDPLINETYSTCLGGGAKLNGEAIEVSSVSSLGDGSVAVGHSMRVPAKSTVKLLDALLHAQGMFYRNGSGALKLAYVAAGRLIGYCEPHMNAWDCLAGLLLIEEAGGGVQPYDMSHMLTSGGSVVAAAPGVQEALFTMADKAYNEASG